MSTTARPAVPPRVCGRCSKDRPNAPVHTDWHCPNPQCTWTICNGCRGLTDVASMLPGRGDQKQ